MVNFVSASHRDFTNEVFELTLSADRRQKDISDKGNLMQRQFLNMKPHGTFRKLCVLRTCLEGKCSPENETLEPNHKELVSS